MIEQNPSAPESKVLIVQGDCRISNEPGVIFTTLLGSCVSLCLHDPLACIGGMNHFLLPGAERRDSPAKCSRYGADAMAMLLSELLARGARRSRLEAKLFGGARMLAGVKDLGSQNATFAEAYLRRENIALAGASLGGDRGRRVEFWPRSGRTRQLWVGLEAAGLDHGPNPAPARSLVPEALPCNAR
jgi:chemotaxis protein CheD